jgi:ketol-acid reductoisomerase
MHEQCFRVASFTAGINRLTRFNSTGGEYGKFKQITIWVAYLDARQEQTSIMTDLSEREMVHKWMENQKYSREEILAVVRNNKWRQIKQYTVAETSKLPLTRRQKDTLLSPIQKK